MAIIIPSKKIYDKNNPKVIENSINRMDIVENNVQMVKTNERTDKLNDILSGNSVITTSFASENINDTNSFRFSTGIETSALSWSAEKRLNRKKDDYYITDIAPTFEAVYETTISKVPATSYPAVEYNGRRFDFGKSDKVYNSRSKTDNSYNIDISETSYDYSNNLQLEYSLSVNNNGVFAQFSSIDISKNYEATTFITFFINGISDLTIKTFTAFQGMTWSQFIISDFNDGSFTSEAYNDYIGVKYNGYFLNALKFGVPYVVDITEIIEENYNYTYNDNFEPSESTSTIGIALLSSIKLNIDASQINSCFPYKIKTTETTDYFDLSVLAISELTIFLGQDYIPIENISQQIGRPIESLKVDIKLKEAKIVYNETVRRLESKDKAIVLENSSAYGEAKFSIGKNPFIRTGNLYDGEENATYTIYNGTLTNYNAGKETATILCGIGEYYDENGNLVISTKTPDKMMFEHYDKVVPMVRNGIGADVPMSLNSSGVAKVFDVVGVREIYDGAILQELTLREYDAVEIPQTTYRTYANKGGGLTYEITSSQVVTEINSAGGITYIIGE